MQIGVSLMFQNPGNHISDRDLWKEELRIATRAETLGYDSVWGIEHHFTDYILCPDVVQFLTYVAAKTERVALGTSVIVAPWHDPMRVAETVSVLDHMSDGRMILGFGRFVESVDAVCRGLEQGYVEYAGQFIQQPRRDIRPAPFKTFRGRTYAAAVSPESARIMAELGVGILIIAQKPWEQVEKELAEYRSVFREVNGADAPPPITASVTYCDENADRAEEMAEKYIGGYFKTVVKHYEVAADHFGKAKGYESYSGMATMLDKMGVDGMAKFFYDLQVWGTPEQCYEKVMFLREQTGTRHLANNFSYAGMPFDQSNRSMELFASAVMPELQKLDV
jgi:alkanesulfonate monooxygenase SsuD/methylene tetrahydromethanopterin reductase-like flavin-dependent oxidoreductase (luciferase family)